VYVAAREERQELVDVVVLRLGPFLPLLMILPTSWASFVMLLASFVDDNSDVHRAIHLLLAFSCRSVPRVNSATKNFNA
jgi:hypothetical protein